MQNMHIVYNITIYHIGTAFWTVSTHKSIAKGIEKLFIHLFITLSIPSISSKQPCETYNKNITQNIKTYIRTKLEIELNNRIMGLKFKGWWDHPHYINHPQE